MPALSIPALPQPYRTTQLVFPGAKAHYYEGNGWNKNGSLYQPPWRRNGGAAVGSSEAIENQVWRRIAFGFKKIPVYRSVCPQPFRTAPLVTPAPKTIIDAKQRRGVRS